MSARWTACCPFCGKTADLEMRPGKGGPQPCCDDCSNGAAARHGIDGAELLDDIRKFITRYMVLPSDAAADVLALYVIHTWALDAAIYTPYLHVRSPVKRAGKSRLLEVLKLLCRNAVKSGSITAAAVYQTIEQSRPTLLIDEVDRLFGAKGSEHAEALAGVLNDGFEVDGGVMRGTQGGDPRKFSTWCPKVLAGIENATLPDTLVDRCIAISLERKLKGDIAERFRARDAAGEAADLRKRCAGWSSDHMEALAEYRLPTFGAISDRAEDIWEPLFAIADAAAGHWPERVCKACLALAGEESGEESDAITLLSDIRNAFRGAQTISTVELLLRLNALEGSPWGARRPQAFPPGLDARGLAGMLKPFRTHEGVPIHSKSVRVSGQENSVKGYHADDFADALARYLPGDSKSDTSDTSVTSKPQSQADVSYVTDVSEVHSAGEQMSLDACRCTEWTATVGRDRCQACGLVKS